SIIHPENHSVREKIVFREDVLNMAIVIAPACPSFQHPGEHPHRGIAESVGKGARIEHMHGQMGGETALEGDDPGPDMFRYTLWNRMPAAEIPGPIPTEQT